MGKATLATKPESVNLTLTVQLLGCPPSSILKQARLFYNSYCNKGTYTYVEFLSILTMGRNLSQLVHRSLLPLILPL